MIWNLAVKDRDDVFADRPVPPVGLDDDSLEQVVRDVDRPALDALPHAGICRLRLPGGSPLPRGELPPSRSRSRDRHHRPVAEEK